MILSDERELYWNDIEKLSRLLENKSIKQIESVLNTENAVYKVTKIYVTHENFGTWYQRLAHIPVVPLLFVLAGVKWLFTGQMHLDSWARKYKPVGVLYKMIGYEV